MNVHGACLSDTAFGLAIVKTVEENIGILRGRVFTHDASVRMGIDSRD